MTESPEAPEPARTELAPRPRGFVRRGVFELLGLSRYSRPALHGIDRRLNPYYDAVDELTHHDVLYRWKDR